MDMRRRTGRWAGRVLLFAAALFLAARAAAAQENGIQFLGEEALVVTLPPGEDEATRTVAVFNGSGTEQTVSLQVVGPATADGSLPPAGVLPEMPLTETVAAGAVTSFTLVVARAVGMGAAVYEGQLVATSSEGGVDRLGFTLQAPPAPVEIASGATPAFLPRYIESLRLQQTRRCPSFVDGNCTPDISIPLAEPWQGAPALVGALVGPEGQVGYIWRGEEALAISGLAEAGIYEGSIELQDDSETEPIAVTVQVRDALGWPLVFLVTGVIVSTLLAHIAKKRLPQGQLALRLAQLKEEVCELQKEAKEQLPGAWPHDGELPLIYDAEEEAGLLHKAAVELQSRFNEARSDAERARWNVDGEQYGRFANYKAALAAFYDLGRQSFEHYTALKGVIADFESHAVAEQWRQSLQPGVIGSVTKFERRQGQLKGAAEQLALMQALLVELNTLKGLARLKDHKTEASELIGVLRRGFVERADQLALIRGRARRLELDILRAETAGMEEEEEEDVFVFFGRSGAEVLERTPLLPRLGALPLLRDVLTELLGIEALAARTPEEIQARLRRLDIAFAVGAGAVAIASGFYILYMGNETFGSVADYLGLFLWSTAVDEGLKVARQFALPLLR